MNHQPLSAEQYLSRLASALKKRKVDDIDDILTDYKDYFLQSSAKGYSDTESIRRLPVPEELAASYENDKEKLAKLHSQPTPAQRFIALGFSFAGDLVFLPILGLAVLLLACVAAVGLCLVIVGPLLLVPDNILGQLDVARPPMLQLLPTVLLFIAAGIFTLGACTVITERIYNTIRASIVMRRWLLTGKQSEHVKLVPQISKRLRTLLYKVLLYSGLAALALIMALMLFSFMASGNANFTSAWK